MITLTFAVGNIPILVLSPSYDNEPVYMAVAKISCFPSFHGSHTPKGNHFTEIQTQVKLTARDSKHTAAFFNVTR